MKPHALQSWPAQQRYFLQDNAPYHTSNESRAWLHNNGIDCIDFPPYSPDLNPIENLWADLKRRVELRCPCDSTELKQFLTEEWTATDPEYLRCLAHSMIDRCKVVAACRGFKTKY
jgi:transposase